MKVRTRAESLFGDAVDGLREFYPLLADWVVVDSIRQGVKVPDTGDDQADYENVRDQVELAASKAQTLFAAAPDLLAACKSLLSELGSRTAMIETCDMDDGELQAMSAAESAIAKAEGR